MDMRQHVVVSDHPALHGELHQVLHLCLFCHRTNFSHETMINPPSRVLRRQPPSTMAGCVAAALEPAHTSLCLGFRARALRARLL